MRVHRSNRTEPLLDALLRVVAEPPRADDPFLPETIVTYGRGMERWLSRELASHFGIWANAEFLFPQQWLGRVLALATDLTLPDPDPFEPEVLRWTIADLLPQHLKAEAFAPVRTYLEARREEEASLFGLARRIADLFDRYVVYRPEMILGWEEGAEPEDWQAALWRAVVERHGSRHHAALARPALARLRAGKLNEAPPPRLCLFGLTTLPPLYLPLLDALSRHVETHLFLLSPSDAYWGQVRDQRSVYRTQAHSRAPVVSLSEEIGHPLLGALGRVGRDFHEMLETHIDYEEGEASYLDPEAGPSGPTLLSVLQTDMRALRHRGSTEDREAPRPIRPDDTSIRVHSCHGPIREVEVLHDEILDLLERSPDLEPDGIAVLCPDIDSYAPFIDAIFGSVHKQGRIPYHIADRSLRRESEVIDAFLLLLENLAGRWTVNDGLDLLARRPIQERFRIAPEELDPIRVWTREAGIRWGVDALHRGSQGQPEAEEHTWRLGLDRLLLGAALPSRPERLFADRLPVGDAEGDDADLLGRFAHFVESLFSLRDRLHAPRPMAQWATDLTRAARDLLSDRGEDASAHLWIASQLGQLAREAATGGYPADVELGTVTELVTTVLANTSAGRNFLSGGVTFCSLVPMRSLPFRVVALLGMNDGDFPRRTPASSFDRMAREPQRGDRSPRDDDRFLFLEALLSARDALRITYIGRDARDDEARPPSPVVSQLLDCLADSFFLDRESPNSSAGPPDPATQRKEILEQVVTEHPLQPFSPRNFRPGGRLFSYDWQGLAAARRLLAGGRREGSFLTAPALNLAAPLEMSLTDFCSFFRNPCHALLRHQLGLNLEEEAEIVDDRQPVTLARLDEFHIGSRILELRLANVSPKHLAETLRREAALPPGSLGYKALRRTMAEVEILLSTALPFFESPRQEALAIDLEVEGLRITGMLGDLRSMGRFTCRYQRLGREREMEDWILHLVLNRWAQLGNIPSAIAATETHLVGRPESAGNFIRHVGLPALPSAEEPLASLAAICRQGLTSRLPLFPRSSRTYANEWIRERQNLESRTSPPPPERILELAHQHALNRARLSFHPIGLVERVGPPETANPYVDLAFGREEPLETDIDRFAHLALSVFGPLLLTRQGIP